MTHHGKVQLPDFHVCAFAQLGQPRRHQFFNIALNKDVASCYLHRTLLLESQARAITTNVLTCYNLRTMEALTSIVYPQASLPKLSMYNQLCRRDSQSSSKTDDSGYNSNLDPLSPLEINWLEQDVLAAPLSCVPGILVNNNSTAWKIYSSSCGPQSAHRHSITCNPSLIVQSRITPQFQPSVAAALETAIKPSHRQALDCQTSPQGEDIEKWIGDNLPARRPDKRVLSITSLSSTSSCDMYTNTDVSDDEEHDRELVPAQRQTSTSKIIELIMRKVEVSLRQAAYNQYTGSSSAHSRARAAPSSGQNSRKTSVSTVSKRKFRQEGSPPPEDDDEDGPNKRRRGSGTSIDGSETGARFACPYYKHDPDGYRNRRTCPGPGWATVHRMKEHLYRSHSQPIVCPICYATFKSDKEQSNHVRLQACQRSSPQTIEGIDRETMWTLRKRTTALRLEEDKWRDVYLVLFPNVPVADIPSPFYDCGSPSETSRRFRRDLLRRVQEELLIEAGNVPNPVEQGLLQRVAGIIRRCEDELLNQAQSLSIHSLNTERRASGSSTSSSYQATPPAHVPTSSGHELSFSAPQMYSENRHGYVPVINDMTQYLPKHAEPVTSFGHAGWDAQSCSGFSLGINWEEVFPFGDEMLYRNSKKPGPLFSASVWT
ncbi:Nicotinate-nucleotide diphosphorylase [Pyrenophora seminiperda CCB06]|uniref:Nicotinate-nucleotide diphosphorylase n=1 Tax=Pyrenophora seminiperda CCB06 TaxID=1302712 RepID=A0A3M7LYE1_9PLEO|nr:Nicotinate-nucleotide diphosphorylase [Pyrenophora seminiperda CCB06]